MSINFQHLMVLDSLSPSSAERFTIVSFTPRVSSFRTLLLELHFGQPASRKLSHDSIQWLHRFDRKTFHPGPRWNTPSVRMENSKLTLSFPPTIRPEYAKELQQQLRRCDGHLKFPNQAGGGIISLFHRSSGSNILAALIKRAAVAGCT